MNADRWTFKHIEQLIDSVNKNRKLTELSATKTSTCNDLVSCGLLAFGVGEHNQDYLCITLKGTQILDDLVASIKVFAVKEYE